VTVEIAQLAVQCAEAQLGKARETLIDAIVAESGRDPKAQLNVSFRELLRVLRGKASVHFEAKAEATTRPTDPRF
jgi:hypothetical protein